MDVVRIEAALKIDGWMSPEELTWLAEQASSHHNILEIGSYKGRSSRAMFENMPPGGKLTCVDMERDYDTRNAGNMEQLEANLKSFDGLRVAVFCRRSSKEHAELSKGVLYDMIFIDGQHDYASVSEDITLWRERMYPGGLLCGHDYWPAPDRSHVAMAVDDLLPGASIAPGTTIWYVEMWP